MTHETSLNVCNLGILHQVNYTERISFQVTAENLKWIAESHSKTYFTIGASGIEAISFNTIIKLPQHKNAIRIDTYYHGNSDIKLLASHVHAFLLHLESTANATDMYYIKLHYPIEMDTTEVVNTFDSVFGRSVTEHKYARSIRALVVNTKHAFPRPAL